MTHPNPDPLRSALEINPDLVERCKELLQWGRTGLLNNGSGGAVRALAKSLEQSVGAHQAMSVAEFKTRDEAMSEVVRIAALASPQGREAVTERDKIIEECAKVVERALLLQCSWGWQAGPGQAEHIAKTVRALKSSAPDA